MDIPKTANSSPGLGQRHKIIFGLVIAVSVLSYVAFNVWIYQYSKGGDRPPAAVRPPAVSVGQYSAVPTPSAPTPRPTGPGPYACDEYGICNIYEDSKRAGCPKTYADSHCLDKCADQSVRCPKQK